MGCPKELGRLAGGAQAAGTLCRWQAPDSGWPGDNYEVTRAVRDLLVRRGYQPGVDLMYLAFPNALHNEQSWAMRSHIPLQFFFSKLSCIAP